MDGVALQHHALTDAALEQLADFRGLDAADLGTRTQVERGAGKALGALLLLPGARRAQDLAFLQRQPARRNAAMTHFSPRTRLPCFIMSDASKGPASKRASSPPWPPQALGNPAAPLGHPQSPKALISTSVASKIREQVDDCLSEQRPFILLETLRVRDDVLHTLFVRAPEQALQLGTKEMPFITSPLQ